MQIHVIQTSLIFSDPVKIPGWFIEKTGLVYDLVQREGDLGPFKNLKFKRPTIQQDWHAQDHSDQTPPY